RNSSPWLPVSATEWIDSASIDAEPVITNAANFETAMPRLARNAAMIARRVPSADIAHGPHRARGDAHELPVESPAAQHRRPALVAVEAAVELVLLAVGAPVDPDQTGGALVDAEPLVPPVVEASVGSATRRSPDVHALLAVRRLQRRRVVGSAELADRVE